MVFARGNQDVVSDHTSGPIARIPVNPSDP